MKKIIVLCVCCALLGCVSAPVTPEILAAANEPLLCADKKQCDFYWQRAQVWVSGNSGYKIQTVTDALIQTHGPFGSKVELAHKIVRAPNEDGSARILISSACDNMFGCQPSRESAAANFKRFVRLGY